MTIGERIKNRRIELGMTQTELSAKMGYKDRSTISYIEKDGGNLPIPKVKVFAKVLHTTVEYLMGWEETIPAELTEEETELIRYFRSLNEDGQDRVLSFAKFCNTEKEYIKNSPDKTVEVA